MILAGRGAGKTRSGSEWIRSQVCGKTPLGKGAHQYVHLVAETAADARDVMVEGVSGLLAVHPRDFRPKYEPSKRRLTWPNGAQATLFNATEPDQLRGPQCDLAWCLIGDTLVETATGAKAIKDITLTDQVWTRAGLRQVVASELTSSDAEIWELTTKGGRRLIGTPNHRVFTPHRGFVPLRSLRNGDTLIAWNTKLQYGAESAGISTGITTAIEKVGSYIGSFTKSITESFRPTLMFITSTRTRLTTTFPIWRQFPEGSIFGSTAFAAAPHGIASGDRAIHSRQFGNEGTRSGSVVPNVGMSSARMGCERRFAHLPARLRTSGSATPDTGLNTRNDAVLNVKPLKGRRAVYDIQVDGASEFFAQGLLVHNSDELAKWRYAQETWDMLQFGLRLGDPRQMVTTTPRPIKIIRDLLADPTTVVTKDTTFANSNNLAPAFLEQVKRRYSGTRLGRQELNAEVLEDSPDALWTRAGLDQHRRKQGEAPKLKRIVVAIDPAAKTNEQKEDGAATGIVVAGAGEDGRGYVLDDATLRASPNGWARRAVACYDRFEADAIVAEVNNGGDMVEATIRSVRDQLPVIKVHASRGKWTRAEPVAALYEQGRISHVGTFAELEDEMVLFGPNGMADGVSPDRVDALVWALSELFPQLTAREKPKAVPVAHAPRGAQGWMG